MRIGSGISRKTFLLALGCVMIFGIAIAAVSILRFQSSGHALDDGWKTLDVDLETAVGAIESRQGRLGESCDIYVDYKNRKSDGFWSLRLKTRKKNDPEIELRSFENGRIEFLSPPHGAPAANNSDKRLLSKSLGEAVRLIKGGRSFDQKTYRIGAVRGNKTGFWFITIDWESKSPDLNVGATAYDDGRISLIPPDPDKWD